jgi:cell shape-determining protein MreC
MTGSVLSTMFVSLAAAIVAATWLASRHLSASGQARATLATGKKYRSLADEYRRLSDTAITAITSQEDTELKLTELDAQVSELRDKLDRVERVLNEAR